MQPSNIKRLLVKTAFFLLILITEPIHQHDPYINKVSNISEVLLHYYCSSYHFKKRPTHNVEFYHQTPGKYPEGKNISRQVPMFLDYSIIVNCIDCFCGQSLGTDLWRLLFRRMIDEFQIVSLRFSGGRSSSA